jgi:hypothetical protein
MSVASAPPAYDDRTNLQHQDLARQGYQYTLSIFFFLLFLSVQMKSSLLFVSASQIPARPTYNPNALSILQIHGYLNPCASLHAKNPSQLNPV